MAEITMYATAWCPYCRRARELLRSKGQSWNEIDIDERPAAKAEMMKRSGRHTVPQIWIGETHVGGFDDLDALDRAGRLDPLLES